MLMVATFIRCFRRTRTTTILPHTLLPMEWKSILGECHLFVRTLEVAEHPHGDGTYIQSASTVKANTHSQIDTLRILGSHSQAMAESLFSPEILFQERDCISTRWSIQARAKQRFSLSSRTVPARQLFQMLASPRMVEAST